MFSENLKTENFQNSLKKRSFFNEKVLQLTKKIPCGKITTYKIIAKKLGTKAYRAVGNALNKNTCLIIFPCHRVVKSNRELGGYRKGTKKKIILLKKEGIKIENNKIKNFEKVLFRF